MQKNYCAKTRIIKCFQLFICHDAMNHELHHSHQDWRDAKADDIREDDWKHIDYIAECLFQNFILVSLINFEGVKSTHANRRCSRCF